MSITISIVKNRKDTKEFIRLPYGIYRGKKERFDAWVPPLDMDVKHLFSPKNPMYDHTEAIFWLARENGKAVGRIAAFIDDNFIRFHNTQTGFFGFFECHKHPEVSKLLFETAEKWLRQKGMEKVTGPVNGSTNFQIGNQIDSFEKMPVIEMPYSPPFYSTLIEDAGYSKAQDLYSYRIDSRVSGLSPKISRVAEIAAKRNRVTLRPTNTKNWEQEVDIVKSIWEDAWHDNWGFTPWHAPEFKAMANNLKLIIIPEMTYIAEIDGEAVGFCFPVPDINFAFHKINGKLLPFGIFALLKAKKNFTQIRMAAFGVRKAYQNKAIDGIMIKRLWDNCIEREIFTGEFSWILEQNYELRNLLENWGCEHYRTHRVYEKPLVVQT